MRIINVKQPDDKNEEIVSILISLGMNRAVAQMLSYLQSVSEATSVEIERGAGLRQPEVSIATKELKELDWINEREEKKLSKGRPYRIYSLKIGFNEIVAHLEAQKKKAIGETLLKLERLKALGNIASAA